MKKKNFIPLIYIFAGITLNIPSISIAQNNIYEICNKLEDPIEFRNCITSGQSRDETNAEEFYTRALDSFDSADSLNSIKFINKFLEKSPNAKKGYILRSLIYIYDFSEFDKALEDIEKALEIDKNYAYAHALKGALLYFDLGGSFSNSIKYINKGLSLSPRDPHINFIAADVLLDNAFVHLDKDKKELALTYFEKSQIFLKNTLDYMDLISYKNMAAEHTFPIDFRYTTTALLGDAKYELFFLYRDKKQRDLSKKYLNEAISLYSTAISIGPTQEEVEKIESDRDLDLISPADLYRARGNMFSWDKKWNQACSDWKVSKKYGDKDARDNYRDFKC